MTPLGILLDYPLFRCLLFLAAGIFFFDSFPLLPLRWLEVGMGGLSVGYLCLSFFRPRVRWAGSLWVFAFSFLLGGWLLGKEQQRLHVAWSAVPTVYRATLLSVEEKAASCRMTVGVQAAYTRMQGWQSFSGRTPKVLLQVPRDSMQPPEECKKLKIPYYQTNEEGYYRIW